MADYNFEHPEIIPFEGAFSEIPEIRELIGDDFGVIDRYFVPDDAKTLVSLIRLPSRPDTYSFVLQDENSEVGGPRAVFDLVMGSEYSDYARLYTFMYLGENALKGLSKENGDHIFQAWHHVQVETGAIYPNPEERKLFEDIFLSYMEEFK